MFRQARVKLTAQYVAIIMLVSFSFSSFIYKTVSTDFQRRLNVIERRLSDNAPRGWHMQGPVHEYFLQDLKDAKYGFLLTLIYANGMIFLMSSAAGYFLAGKTLEPIENAMNEQKRFVADASHELKTPLTALQTSIEVALRDKKLSLKDAKYVLKGNLDDVEGLKKLSNNLLALTTYQQNGDKMIKTKVSVKEVISVAYNKVLPLAKKKNIKVKINTKSYKLKANRESLEKLVTILLDNAVKYTNKGGKINLSASTGRRYLTLKVKDTGVGISKKDLPHIFDRFYQADQSRSKVASEGFGLGLSMAKKVVKLHGGSIKANSKVNKGSTFTVKLPLR